MLHAIRTAVSSVFSNVNEYENGNDWYAFTKTRMMLSYETKII